MRNHCINPCQRINPAASPLTPWPKPHEQVQWIIFSFWILLAMCAGSGFVLAQEYTVTGTLTHSDLQLSGAEAAKFQEKFQISVSGEKWMISESADVNGKRFSKETGFDGTNVFRLMHFAPEVSVPRKPAPISIHGSISAQDMPDPDPMFCTCPLWLGFASGSYLTRAEPGSLRPVWMLDDWGLWHTGFKVPSIWRLSSSAPHLPESVAYYDDGNSQGAGKRSATESGFTNVAYSAAFTNVDGMAFASRFVLRRYFPALLQHGRAQPAVLALDEATVETIASGCQFTSFRPALTGVVLISDCRLDKKFPGYAAQYLATNGDWKVTSLAKLSARHESEESLPKPVETSSVFAKRTAILGAMLLATGAFVPLMTKATRKVKD